MRYHHRTGSIYWARDVPLRSKMTACNPPLRGTSLAASLRHPALRAKRLWRSYGSVVFIQLHHFSQPSPARRILFIASSTPRRLQVYWVDLNPLTDCIPSNPSPDWLIYILYSGIPYTCVIYLYITSSHSTATPSCNRSLWHILTYHACERCDADLAIHCAYCTAPYHPHGPSITCRLRISCFARLYIREIWLLLPLSQLRCMSRVLLLVGRRDFVGTASNTVHYSII